MEPIVNSREPLAARNALAWIGLGANLGDAAQTLTLALQALHALQGVKVAAVSSFWRSAPVDAPGPSFINAVARIQSELEPKVLLRALLRLERNFGRERPFPNAPRTLDLDLLLYNELDLKDETEPALTLPHPRMQQRAFVLAPLAEIDPDLILPGGAQVARLLSALQSGDNPNIAPQTIERLPGTNRAMAVRRKILHT